MYLLNHYNYTLPGELIAQVPVSKRDQSRLMLLDREHKRVSHHRFSDLVRLLHPGDLLVVNDTRVVQGRLKGIKETGGKAEVLLIDYPQQLSTGQLVAEEPRHGKLLRSRYTDSLICNCLIKASKRPSPGSRIYFNDKLSATVLAGTEGVYKVVFHHQDNFDALLENIGEVPLPPYITRNGQDTSACDDRRAYQTVYATKKGAVAAPTAGLHFTPELLKRLINKGVEVVTLTLHVGYATFLPVRVTDIRQHAFHSEAYELTKRSASIINEAKDAGRRVIAVGTTSARVLEYAAYMTGCVQWGSGKCDLFIYPGFEFKVVDALITNFHLPKSTLLMLVSAFAGREFILDSYQKAIQREYRFYSYGDAMLIC